MDRSYYLGLAESGLRMPIAADLVLHEKEDAEAILIDGTRLGRVLEETARRFQTPLAVSHMDLELDKVVLLTLLGIPADQAPKYHFSAAPTDEQMTSVDTHFDLSQHPRLKAHVDSIAWIAGNTDLVPVGMAIGPFSLMTKLLADPIMPIYLAGTGIRAEDDTDVNRMERILELATRLILRSLEIQIKAGAKLVFIAEPAANRVFLSPRQIDGGSDIFERYPMAANKRIKQLLDQHGVDLLFHCCGELTDGMVRHFTELRPVILSLGSSRVLWKDAALVPDDIVLYGNLPSKRFYSDDLITEQQVEEQACALLQHMKDTKHPFILGSECDILSVPGCHDTILKKAEIIAHCRC